MKNAKFAAVAILGLAGAVQPTFASAAEPYPNRPITMIVPFPAGGPTDIVARVVGQKLSEDLGQSVIIDNKPGASSVIGAGQVARAAPDGYTLLLNYSGHVINPFLKKDLPFDPLRDFEPIVGLASTPQILVVSPKVQAKSVEELIKLIKDSGKGMTFASSSVGAPGHLAGELFGQMTKLPLMHVPYRGSAPALTDLVGGQVDMMFDSAPSSISFVRSGKLKALGVTSEKRTEVAPELPTLDESGLKGFAVTTWYGVWAPAKTPVDIVEKLNGAINKALADPDVRAKLLQAGADPLGGSRQDFAEFCRSESKRYGAIVKAANIQPQS
ncbi:Bug family tripartite tricarboxylate transporter substrate binding protein [Parapusillimonas granuli]|uniref:Tripartite tricarboxylate transporter substrate binding protein n=1 Tax=Parapusillimonas granuli TaxID=380911 RepID=A0A853G274_9BURK|nr:tripartite tricarboxylate transporter substrate binding protein [Parapusillimonas granuli]MBB5215380.1 tripartite-type tricarboxylate transporter receptor subunit TctC [Parapusillimonas granuli]NYT49952.1 tripartite tricarboxylate transporter substrate binding protein [Parapusillimonas granuli]